MSTKTGIDDLMQKIMPDVQTDHGGMTLGDLLVILLDLVLLIYTGYRSWHFLSNSVAQGFELMAIIGLWGLDIGAVFWSLTWIFGSTTRYQNWTSMAMFVIDLLGVMLTSVVDTLAYGGEAGLMPPILQTITWYGVPLIVVGNVIAGFIYHMTSPQTRHRRALREQDEEMSKEQERAALQLRKMTLQLEQAQEYTAKRSQVLLALVSVAKQNMQLNEVERRLMLQLNRAAPQLTQGEGTNAAGNGQLEDLVRQVEQLAQGLEPAAPEVQPAAAAVSPARGVDVPFSNNGHHPPAEDPTEAGLLG